jgi:Tol biopolymer transport system component
MISLIAIFHRIARHLAIVVATGAVLIVIVPAASAAVPNFKAVSVNGEAVFFETEEQLVPGDTDTKRDVYERYFDAGVGAYVTREVSLGPTGGNDAYNAQFEAANAAGTKVFFSTEERLVAEDTDRSTDVYMRDLGNATTTLVSKGEPGCSPGCGNGAFPTTFAGVDETGDEVFFTTQEKLTSSDKDTSVDLYVRKLGGSSETQLVSTGEAGCAAGCGNGEFDVSSRGISADGSHAYFTTAEPLSAADGDTALDIYAHDLSSGQTSLVSRGGCAGCGEEGKVPVFDGSSADGKRVFFTTAEKLSEADHDSAADVYARDLPGGPTILISGGSEGVTASYSAASADGSHVFFTSAEGLVAGDTDGANDVYEWTAGEPLGLVTSSACTSNCGVTFDAVSADSSEVIFNTAEPLSSEDLDSREDVYRQHVGGGEPVLVSRGEPGCTSCWNGSFEANFDEAAADASRVVFSTHEGVLPDDTDGEDDIYVRDIGGESSSLITTSPSFCPLSKGNCGATFVGASEDGRRVFFRTVERFTLEDGDNEADVYERFLGASPSEDVTRLVSAGNSPDLELGPPPPTLTETNPESPAASTSPRVIGDAEANSRVKVYATPDCSGEPAATGTAAELQSPGLKATVARGSMTEFRATAEAEGFVSKCSAPITYRQVEAPSSGGEGSEGESAGGGSTGSRVAQPSSKSAGSGGGALGSPAPSYLTPHTRITFAPASKTRLRNPVFRFTDSTGQSGTTFRCKVDRRPWASCSSPLRLRRLDKGRHVLEILSVNGAGVAESRAAKRTFKVVP